MCNMTLMRDSISKIPDERAKNDLRELSRSLCMPDRVWSSYIDRIRNAPGSRDEATCVTRVLGVIYELSRIRYYQGEGAQLESICFDIDPVTVSFTGYARDNLEQCTKKCSAKIDFDVPIVRVCSDGRQRPYAYEVKSYPRLPYGTSAAARNQLLKYQAAIDEGFICGATLEIKGKIHPNFLEWMMESGFVPDIEIIYCLELPSGAEYRFVLKKSADDCSGLRFDNGEFDLSDMDIVEAIQGAIGDGKIIDILTKSEINEFPSEMTGYVEKPESISSSKVLREYGCLWRSAIYKKLLMT